MICHTANALWLAASVPEARRFHRATTRVAGEQLRLLLRMIEANAATEFGRRHGFSTIRCARDYQQRVPLRGYDEYQPWIDRETEGLANVLTREPVRLFEPTSGSTRAKKLVPYTPTLQRQFQRGIRPWIVDLFSRYPALLAGQSYWSISPAVAAERTRGGTPVGFDDDACYVGGWQQRLVRAVMAAPPELRLVDDMERFRYLTLLSLVRSPNLRLISVWNPTFLSALIDRLPEWGDALLRDLACDVTRARVLRGALAARTAEDRHVMLWPGLAVISCWTDANAAAPASHVASLFPQARVQGKGLIATEGFVSFPMVGQEGCALAIRSHFLEFAPIDAGGRPMDDAPLLAHELETGTRYTVILSTGGGLYRYRLHDVIEVVGFFRQCPLVRFVGRHDSVSDWVGEKLHEAYVADVVRSACGSLRLAPRFAMLACDDALAPPAYVLYIDAEAGDSSLLQLADRIEAELRRSVHYDYARGLQQLGPLRIFRAERACEAYLEAAARGGQRVGSVKPVALDRRSGWSRIFRGAFVVPSLASVSRSDVHLAEETCARA